MAPEDPECDVQHRQQDRTGKGNDGYGPDSVSCHDHHCLLKISEHSGYPRRAPTALLIAPTTIDRMPKPSAKPALMPTIGHRAFTMVLALVNSVLISNQQCALLNQMLLENLTQNRWN